MTTPSSEGKLSVDERGAGSYLKGKTDKHQISTSATLLKMQKRTSL